MGERPPTVRTPTRAELAAKAEKQYITLSEEELDDFEPLAEEFLSSFERLDEIADPSPSVSYKQRESGYRPPTSENPCNAFVTKSRIEPTGDGPLSGYDVGIKDCIAVAGVELTNGSCLFEGFVPSNDATVTTRVLEAGGTITGKLNMEDMAFSGGGELSAFGPVVHPRNDEYLAGGSSSGSAAAVVAEDAPVDVALGTDAAGSVRAPAAWCGCVGFKPTHGLIPFTGIITNGVHTIDHVGTLASNVEDTARLLQAVSGKDTLDPRQDRVHVDDYVAALDHEIDSLTIGVLEEGFAVNSPLEESDPAVDDTVRAGLDTFANRSQAVNLRSVSAPMHIPGWDVWAGIAVEAATAIVNSEEMGHFSAGFYDTQLGSHFASARRTQADQYPPLFKLIVTLGQYLADEYHGQYHAKAQNLARELRGAYDEALADVDALALPTTVGTAIERRKDLSRTELIDRAFNIINTAQFDVTGHPAISVPGGTAGGLPVGVMFVGPRWEDAMTLRVAAAFERTIDWTD